MRFFNALCALAVALTLSAGIYAQSAGSSTVVPRLIRFNSSYHTASQPAQTGVVGATFSIYRQQHEGTPLWSEIQNIQPDKDGSYTVLLGSTRTEGMPLELFTSTEPRWLEVEIDQVKQPRILLSSVPYALKSADADTLGGLPPSAYLRVNPTLTNSTSAVVVPGVSPLANNGSPNCIGVFLNTTDLVCSTINQGAYAGNPSVSVGGTATLGALTLIGSVPSGDAAGVALYNQGGGGGASVSLDMYNTQANGGIPQAKMKAIDDGNYSDHLTFWTKTPGGSTNAVTEKVRITSTGNVGIGTSTPSQKLEVAGTGRFDSGVMFGDGTTQITATLIGQQGPTGPQGPAGPQGPQGPAGTSQWTSNGSNIYYNSGNVGIGTTTPGGKLEVAGNLKVSGTAGANGIIFPDGTMQTTALITPAGGGNTALGTSALAADTYGPFNTALGSQALYNLTSGIANTATGYHALYNNIEGLNNTASGFQALFSTYVGSNNTVSGYEALFMNVDGSGNTASGFQALQNSTTGSYDIALGYNAGADLTSGSYDIMLGNQGLAADDHVIRIGDVQTQTFIAGVSGVNVSGVNVLVSSTGQLGIASSSRRFKEDIQDMGDATQGLLRLRPVTFRYKQPFADGSQPKQYGLIAEEVAEVYPDLVAHSADGQIETVKYQVLDSMLLNELQRQNAQLTMLKDHLNAQVSAQTQEIRTLQERLARMEALLERTSTRTASR